MKKNNNFKKIFVTLSILLVVILVASYVGFKIYTSNYYAADKAVIDDIREHVGDRVMSFTDATGTVFIPSDGQTKAVIVFYPGGKVEFSAYSGLMYELSEMGYVCVIPRMPDNLAFLGIDVVDDIRKKYADEMIMAGDAKWYLAGHSLGGVAASKYLAEKADNKEAAIGDGKADSTTGSGPGDGKISAEEIASAGESVNGGFAGLILCASYPVDDLSESGLRFLSVYAEKDSVINLEKYEESRAFWPKDSTERIINGGIHSFFGCYGIQAGDGVPDISNQTQLDETAKIIDEWITGRNE